MYKIDTIVTVAHHVCSVLYTLHSIHPAHTVRTQMTCSKDKADSIAMQKVPIICSAQRDESSLLPQLSRLQVRQKQTDCNPAPS